MAEEQIKHNIANAIKAFSSGNLTANSMNLFQTLNYNTERNAHLAKTDFKNFKDSYLTYNSNFNEAKAFVSEWKYVDLLFQLSKYEILKQSSLFDVKKVDNTLIETYLFFVIELKGDHYTRGNLSSITREVNKVFPMPVMILFRHNNSLTLSVINRRLHKRDEGKDVLEKVTLIKDINIEQPHRAHIEILFDLSFEQLKYKHNFTNFVELHEAWQKTLDTKELNNKFFQELSNWYFWAISKTTWPDDDEQLKKKDVRNATNVIRLITRLIFIWFLKEKKLVDDVLFNEKELKSILNNSDSNDSTYYKAILQNLFFATLNTPLDKRTFRTKRTFQGKNNDRGNPFVFRYENYFNKDITELYEHIPFLNGGLFDCLDYKDEKGKIVHIDGFSEEKDNPLKVPDKLFFGKQTNIDLSSIYNDRKKSNAEVRGLINILDSYKFTITENTPIEEEVALDPELLGRVFENLLAYYNPETETTARKQTGSFYTPREIVNYMVDESLIAYLKTKILEESFSYIELGSDQMDLLGNKARKGQLKIEEDVNPNRWIGKEKNLENELRALLSYSESELHFNSAEKIALVKAIDNIKVLDPACGSGAFPMGMLHKLVHILHRLDPQNQMWKQKQIEFASQIQEPTARENTLKNIDDIFNPENNYADYGRKLFLIRNCIYGVDIQPIAIQIAKLRFFISLLIDQSINTKKDNHNIDPLPNLESKFVCANTLIGLKKSTSTGNLFDENYDKIVQLKSKFAEIRKNYFNIRLPQEKKKLHDEYLKTRNELIKILGKDKAYSFDAPLMVAYDPYNPLNVSPFFDVEWMFGFAGFDIIIGNPPYIRIHKQVSKNKEYYKENYVSAKGDYDIYVLFIERCFNVVKDNGIISLITPDKYLVRDYGYNLRSKILKYKIIELFDLSRATDIFDASVYPLISLFSKVLSTDNIKIKIASTISSLYLDYKSFDINKAKLGKDNKIEIIDPSLNVIIEKVLDNPRLRSILLGDQIFCGTPRAKDYHSWSNYISNKYSRDSLKLYVCSTLSPYTINHSKTIHTVGLSISTPYFNNKSQNISEKRWRDFSFTPKILIRGNDKRITAALDNEGSVFIGVYAIKVYDNLSKYYKYLLASLNSKLFQWIFSIQNPSIKIGGGYFSINSPQILNLPFKQSINDGDLTLINKLVDNILSKKSQNPAADITSLEIQIDQMVYKLYDLTEEEIAIIEGKS